MRIIVGEYSEKVMPLESMTHFTDIVIADCRTESVKKLASVHILSNIEGKYRWTRVDGSFRFCQSDNIDFKEAIKSIVRESGGKCVVYQFTQKEYINWLHENFGDKK